MNDNRTYETTGQFLRGCRIRKGLLQKDIIELTDMSKHTISKIESDDKDRIIGQIDIDSNDIGVFDEVDRQYLRQISEMIVKKVITI